MLVREVGPQCGQNLVPGTHIKTWSTTLPFFKHHAIVGWPLPDGTPTAVHNILPSGVSVTPLAQGVCNGHPIEQVRVPVSLDDQLSTLKRAYASVGRVPWTPGSNCEHFATWASTGESRSLQWVRVGLGATILLLWLAGRK